MERGEIVEIDASAEVIWRILADVERWPSWSRSFISIERLEGSGLALGSRVRIVQPKMPALEWVVTESVDASSFTWEASSSGLRTRASHILTAGPEGRSIVTLNIEQSGSLSRIVGLLAGSRTSRYLAMEAAGLKAAAEAAR